MKSVSQVQMENCAMLGEQTDLLHGERLHEDGRGGSGLGMSKTVVTYQLPTSMAFSRRN